MQQLIILPIPQLIKGIQGLTHQTNIPIFDIDAFLSFTLGAVADYRRIDSILHDLVETDLMFPNGLPESFDKDATRIYIRELIMEIRMLLENIIGQQGIIDCEYRGLSNDGLSLLVTISGGGYGRL